jgi:peptidyl-tRNA hydrolase, PTH1 family
MSISLVAGLGNPGREYEATRHNLGWVVVDALARKHGLAWQSSTRFEAELARWDFAPGHTRWLAKPQTFMNASGRSVAALARFHQFAPESIVAVYDDLTIEVGLMKVTVTGSAGGHNGAASLIEHLGESFIRFRLGIGPKEPAQMDLSDFVLGKFTPAQQTILNQKLTHHVEGLELLLTRGTGPAMNQLNRREPK